MANDSKISDEFGSSNAESLEERRNSSVQENMNRPTRKRVNTEKCSPAKETASKRSKFSSNVHNTSLVINDETKSTSNIQKNNSSVKKIMSIADLPPEMLEKILQRVTTANLLNCRQINRDWNEISSRILRRRSDIELKFSFKLGKFMQSFRVIHYLNFLGIIYNSYYECSSKSLADLEICLKDSKHFPCTSFYFDLCAFGNEDMRSFLSCWGKNILSLNVSLISINSVKILRDLLFEKVPNLKALKINFPQYNNLHERIPFSILLPELSLPQLEVLRVSRYRKYYAIIENIIKAACNLNHFEQNSIKEEEEYQIRRTCVVESITAEDLAMLENLNKLHCVKNIQIDLTESLIVYWGKSTKNLMLQSLALSVKPSIWQNNQLKSSATAIINQLFHSSKDVIQTLAIEPLGSLQGLNIPKMEKLNKLEMFEFPLRGSTMFPQHFEMADNFPNLKEMDIEIIGEGTTFSPAVQPLKPMPSILVLRIFGDMSTECKDNLMKATPNVTKLFIDENSDPLSSFRTIANYLTKLQSFYWSFCRYTHRRDLMYSLDAAITGLSEEFCKENSVKFRSKDSLNPDEIASHQLQSRDPSILDLKELRQFDVDFKLDRSLCAAIRNANRCNCEDADCERFIEKDDEAGFGPESMFYKTGFTKVSKFLAFDLMPNLKVHTHRNTY